MPAVPPNRPGNRLPRALAWSVLFALLALGSGLLLVTGIAAVVVWGDPTTWLQRLGLAQVAVQGIGLSVAAAVSTALVARRLGLDWADLRWTGTGSPPLAGIIRGSLLGIGPAILALILAVGLGGSGWMRDAGGWGDYLLSGLAVGSALAPAAVAEEILFRGLPLVLLSRAIGPGAAVVLVAVPFGLFHGLNPEVTALGVANVALAGVLLGTVFFCPGGIWAAFGAHLGWNLTLALADSAVSGLPLGMPLVDYRPGAVSWLTGGAFGPEGGVAATVALAVGVVVAARWAGKGDR